MELHDGDRNPIADDYLGGEVEEDAVVNLGLQLAIAQDEEEAAGSARPGTGRTSGQGQGRTWLLARGQVFSEALKGVLEEEDHNTSITSILPSQVVVLPGGDDRAQHQPLHAWPCFHLDSHVKVRFSAAEARAACKRLEDLGLESMGYRVKHTCFTLPHVLNWAGNSEHLARFDANGTHE